MIKIIAISRYLQKLKTFSAFEIFLLENCFHIVTIFLFCVMCKHYRTPRKFQRNLMWFEKNHGHRFHAALPQSASYHAKMQQDNISRRHERLPIISQLCDAWVRLLSLVCTNICISTDLDIFLQLIQSILFEIFNSVPPLYASPNNFIRFWLPCDTLVNLFKCGETV